MSSTETVEIFIEILNTYDPEWYKTRIDGNKKYSIISQITLKKISELKSTNGLSLLLQEFKDSEIILDRPNNHALEFCLRNVEKNSVDLNEIPKNCVSSTIMELDFWGFEIINIPVAFSIAKNVINVYFSDPKELMFGEIFIEFYKKRNKISDKDILEAECWINHLLSNDPYFVLVVSGTKKYVNAKYDTVSSVPFNYFVYKIGYVNKFAAQILTDSENKCDDFELLKYPTF